MLSRLLATAALAMLGAASARAATLSFDTATPAPLAVPAATATSGPVLQGLTGTLPGSYTSVFDNTAFAGTGSFTAVQAGGAATYALGDSSGISFVWGTPDALNRVAFLSGGVEVDAVVGSALEDAPGWASALFPDWISGTLVTIIPDADFDTVVFSSGSTAFEFANIETVPAAVPLPAAGLLLAGGLAGMGMIARRRAG